MSFNSQRYHFLSKNQNSVSFVYTHIFGKVVIACGQTYVIQKYPNTQFKFIKF